MDTVIQCLKCRGTRIARGELTTSGGKSFDVVFKPLGVQLFKFTDKGGVGIPKNGYACLDCGTVWSQIDAVALTGFIDANCKQSAVGKINV
jgi:predicted nucleic-acid-binding Zn-ribbon protein